MSDNGILKMSDVSKMLGVSARRLRKYCSRDIVPGMKLVRFGERRTFTPEQVDYLRQAVLLSRAGFSAKDLRKYVKLMQSNSAKARTERMAMLRTHKRQVWQELEDLQAAIDFLERQEELLG